ncbi:protein kinase [Streptomyces sp. NPDC057654]|uniref:protein kinase domain-containing protein n=1 Tax=Streptomyces sp. NPDC057654 TaxID=3346196 RepID=UPI003699913C
MAETHNAQEPSEPDATGAGMPDSPELWGNGGLVGDGRYRLTGRLGRGGMAEVFAAEDVRLGRTVAVKLLRADLAEDPVSKARFTREAQSVAGLNHHAVVAVYDSGEDTVTTQGGYGAGGPNVVPYIVMELVEGRTIRELLLNAEAPPPEQALIIVSGVLEALAYSHQHGIVHRDIKPANVIITNSGAVKVMDFGIARALHGAASTMTQTGMVMGTPQYLSPEQALGKTVDARSDLYATGCLLYELLALRPPFTGETPLSVVYQHVQDTPVPPSQVSGNVPPELDGLVMRSLAKDPDDRFQSAEEMRGLVQYGLQMLQEAGGHTGTWDTGPVAHMASGTPAMGIASTTAMPHPPHGGGDTSQQRILPPGMGGGGDDGGFDGRNGPPPSGNSRGKIWLLAALAVIAITVGVVVAMNNLGSDKGGKTKQSPSPSVSQSTSDEPSETPSDEASRTYEDTDPSGGESDGQSEGGGYPTYHSTNKPTHHTTTPPPTGPTQSTGKPTTDPTHSGGDDGGKPTGKPTDGHQSPPPGGDPDPGKTGGGSDGSGSIDD